MPSSENRILNRAASSSFAVGDTLSAINARYRRRIENEQGTSLTGFVASATITAINFHIDNYLEVYLFEDPSFDVDQDIALLNFEPVLMGYWAAGLPRLTAMIQERFLSPYQLRYGHEYVLLARLIQFVAAVPAIDVRLTPLGFENIQKKEPFILR